MGSVSPRLQPERCAALRCLPTHLSVCEMPPRRWLDLRAVVVVMTLGERARVRVRVLGRVLGRVPAVVARGCPGTRQWWWTAASSGTRRCCTAARPCHHHPSPWRWSQRWRPSWRPARVLWRWRLVGRRDPWTPPAWAPLPCRPWTRWTLGRVRPREPRPPARPARWSRSCLRQRRRCV
jgi:hypothetical protein